MTLKRTDQALLHKVLDGDADPREVEALSSRMREEPELRTAADQTQAVESLGQSLPILEPSRDLVAVAEQRLLADPAAGGDARKPKLGRWLLVAGAMTASVAALVIWFLARPSSSVSPAEEPVASVRWVVTVTEGATWIHQAGDRRKAALGDLLRDGDRIETESGATATLSMGSERLRVVLDEATRVGVLSAAGSGMGIMFEGGALQATSEPGNARLLQIHLRGSLHKIELALGRIGVLSDGNGLSVVACEQGETTVQTDERSIRITAGYEIQSEASKWGEARPIPNDLKLDVRLANANQRGNGRAIMLSGQTNPGAQVTINGEPVAVAADGAFSYRAEISNEAGEARVSARDALFRKRAVALALKASTHTPATKPHERPPRDSEWESEWDKPRGPG